MSKTYTVDEIVEMIMSAEISIPVERFFREDGSHTTKHEYGLVLLDELCKEIKRKHR